MHGESGTHVLFGWNAAWVASLLFATVYALIIAEKMNRAILALLGAAMLILCGALTQEAAFRGIDFNTIGLLMGMMLIVGITAKSGCSCCRW
jgi:Na+/H+ antiporter NhaD/arsenite permease-like protein